MIQMLAIIYLVIWLCSSLFYAFSDDWFGDENLIGRVLGSMVWGCLTALCIYCLGFILLLLVSLGLGIK